MICVLLGSSTSAWGQHAAPSRVEAAVQVLASAQGVPPEVRWKWPRFRPVQYVTLGVMAVTTGVIAFAWEPQRHAHVRGGALFDSDVRAALRARTPAAQRRAAAVSDVLYMGGTALPLIVDVGLVALGIHGDLDLAAQLLLLDLQSLAASGVLSLSLEHGAGRARPYTQDCQPDGRILDAAGRELPHRCGSRGDNKSLYSGHSAATATIAALTCAHHRNIPLYGGGAADLAPCILSVAVSLGTGITRIMSDEHWATDVLLGWTVGGISGYLLPTLLHYNHRPDAEPSATLLPMLNANTHGAAIGVVGLF